MNKISIALVIVSFIILSVTICSADTGIIFVNGLNYEEGVPIFYTGESLNFSWNVNANIPVLKVWRIDITPHIDMYVPPTIENPLIIENGYDLPGEYIVGQPQFKRSQGNSHNIIYGGRFILEEPYEFECPGDGHGPYSGKTFMTHTTTLSVTEGV